VLQVVDKLPTISTQLKIIAAVKATRQGGDGEWLLPNKRSSFVAEEYVNGHKSSNFCCIAGKFRGYKFSLILK